MISLVTLLLAANNPFLAEGLQHEKDLDFEKCVQRLKQAATQWKNDADELREIELHAGLCQFNLGDRKAAAEHFRVALRIESSTELPPFSSPKALELFAKVKKSLDAQAPPMRDEDLLAEDKPPDPKDPKDAPKKDKKLEPPVATVSTPSPVVAFLSHRAVPLSLGVISLGSAITATVLGARASSLATEANAARFESDFHRLGADATANATASTIAWILAGTSAIGAVLTWWLMGEPPPAPTATP